MPDLGARRRERSPQLLRARRGFFRIERKISTALSASVGTSDVDARTGKLVWRAWSRDDMSAAIDDQQRLRRVVTDAVADMMKLFPTPTPG